MKKETKIFFILIVIIIIFIFLFENDFYIKKSKFKSVTKTDNITNKINKEELLSGKYDNIPFEYLPKEIREKKWKEELEMKEKKYHEEHSEIKVVELPFEKHEVKRIKSFDLLASKKDEDMKQAIDGFKNIYRSKDSSASQKAVALQKLATIYWRTGGNENIAKYIFTGDFEKFSSQNILKGNLALLKESFKIYPLPRTAIEMSFAYIVLGDKKNSLLYLDKYNKMKSAVNPKTFTLYREFLVYRILYNYDKKYKKQLTALYPEVKSKILDGSITKKNKKQYDYYGQSLPFLDVFYLSFLIEENSSDKDIEKIVDEIISYIEKDDNPEKNEFLYFLKIQKEKKECDYIYRTFISVIMEKNDKFKKFLLDHGLPEKCNK